MINMCNKGIYLATNIIIEHTTSCYLCNKIPLRLQQNPSQHLEDGTTLQQLFKKKTTLQQSKTLLATRHANTCNKIEQTSAKNHTCPVEAHRMATSSRWNRRIKLFRLQRVAHISRVWLLPTEVVVNSRARAAARAHGGHTRHRRSSSSSKPVALSVDDGSPEIRVIP